jgi:hypothetical protein
MSNHSIRSRYYQKLGLYQQDPSIGQEKRGRQEEGPGDIRRRRFTLLSGANSSSSSSSSDEENQKQTQQPAPLTSCLRRRSNADDIDSNINRNRVSFHEEVKCIRIPSHRCYSEQDHAQLWNSITSIANEVDRNTFEFWADGGDWRRATEEEHMVCVQEEHPETGVAYQYLVHPATWFRLQAAFQEQFAYQQYYYNGAGKNYLQYGSPPKCHSTTTQVRTSPLPSQIQENNRRRNHRRQISLERKTKGTSSTAPQQDNESALSSFFARPTSLISSTLEAACRREFF